MSPANDGRAMSELDVATHGAGSVAAAAARVAHFYETLTPASVSTLAQFYASDAHFKDPFNDVTGIAAIERVFTHMFATVAAPRFVITARIAQGEQAMLGWDFFLQLRGRVIVIRGVTHLRFDAAGKVVLHRDYWDAAEELYARLPLIGGVMRWLRRRLAAKSD